jgi:hypothetical protein
VLLYHWYERVPLSETAAATVNESAPFLATVVLAAGCVLILGVAAFTSEFTVTVVTVLASVASIFTVALPLWFVTSQ